MDEDKKKKAQQLVAYYADGIPQYSLRVDFIRNCAKFVDAYSQGNVSMTSLEINIRLAFPPQANPKDVLRIDKELEEMA